MASFLTSEDNVHKFLVVFATASFFVYQPVFAQEKPPKLPDYQSWDVQHYGASVEEYKNKETLIYHEDFQNPKGGEEYLVILYEPVSEEEREAILASSENDQYIRESLRKNGPWLAFYFYPDDTAVYVFGYKRNFIEFYRLWKPKWRFIKALHEDEEGWTEKKLSEFLEKKYQLKY